ncbi:MAG: 4a-hydroxytetrahydrobiopterin dehydratase [Henriciella sp.]|nr:4a-hydroxytetrahydrobiopterin dehydratase [Henriciella sp.]
MAEKIGADAALEKLTSWEKLDEDRDAICKAFKFSDFKSAWAFMSGTALKAEQMDHHPEWFNVYNRVDVVLTTHDADGVTELDVTLGSFMDNLAAQLGVQE